MSPILQCLRLNFVTGSNRKFFNFETVRRDLVLLLINSMDEITYLNVYVVSKRNAYSLTQSRCHGGLCPAN